MKYDPWRNRAEWEHWKRLRGKGKNQSNGISAYKTFAKVFVGIILVIGIIVLLRFPFSAL